MKKQLTLLAAVGLMPLGLALAAPAGAADPVYPLGSRPSSVSLYPVAESGRAYPSPLTVGYFGGGYWQGKPVTYTIDVSKVAGFAEVVGDQRPNGQKCTSEATTLTCVVPAPNLELTLTPRKGSKVGDAGALAVTAKTEGATFTPYDVPVQVGGPELALGDSWSPPPIKAIGDQSPIPLTFKNNGRVATDGAVVRIHTSRGTDLLEKYDNCTYGPAGDQNLRKGVTLAICTFEDLIEGGKAYEAVEPLTVKANGRAMNEVLVTQVFRTNEAPKTPEGHTRPNTGKKLTLKPRTASGGSYSDFSRDIEWQVKNTADFAAIGATATGKAGETVKLDLGFHNRGPAAVTKDGRRAAVTADIRIPAGTTVTKVPRSCNQKWQNSTEYYCHGATTMLEDERDVRTFELRIDKVVEGATGTIKVGSDYGGLPESWDPDHANNKAAIVLNPKNPGPAPTSTATPTPTSTAGTGTPTATASASASATTTTAPASGGLASTGTSVVTTAVGAAVVLVGGIALFVAFRRRGDSGGHA